MLNLSYKLYDNRRNRRLAAMCDTAGYIWNHCVALCRRYYKMYGKSLGKYRLQPHIAKLRKRNKFWMVLNSQTVQEICERVHTAYQRFFKKLAKRPPKFKSPRRFMSIVFKQVGWSISGNKFTIKKVGIFKFSYSRYYENIKRIAIKRDAVGVFWLVLTCDMEPKRYDRTGNAAIGIDFGMKTYLTYSDGQEIESPEFYREGNTKRKRLSRALARKPKQRPSKNRTKAKVNLAKSHKESTNRREDHQWKLAHQLCRENAFIALENLSMEGMKRLWGRKISDLAFASFVEKLEQVAPKYGTTIQKVGRYFPSSKLCGCGVINHLLSLRDREWLCASCGTLNQRDLLAANNIKAEGIRLYQSGCKTGLAPQTAVTVSESSLL